MLCAVYGTLFPPPKSSFFLSTDKWRECIVYMLWWDTGVKTDRPITARRRLQMRKKEGSLIEVAAPPSFFCLSFAASGFFAGLKAVALSPCLSFQAGLYTCDGKHVIREYREEIHALDLTES